MKIIIKTLFVFFLLFYCVDVLAAGSKCSYQEQAKLNEAFKDIELKYTENKHYYDYETLQAVNEKDVDQEKLEKSDYEYLIVRNFVLSVLNATDLFDVEITNNINNETKKLGALNIFNNVMKYEPDSQMTKDIVEYTFTFYTSDKTSCPGENYGTKKVTTPRFNNNFNSVKCTEYPQLESCQMWVFFEDEGREKLADRINNEIKSLKDVSDKKEVSKSSFFDFIDRHKKIILISVGGIALAIGSVIAYNKIRYRRKGF